MNRAARCLRLVRLPPPPCRVDSPPRTPATDCADTTFTCPMHHAAPTSNSNFLMGRNVRKTLLFFCPLGSEKMFAAADLFREGKGNCMSQSGAFLAGVKIRFFNEAKLTAGVNSFLRFLSRLGIRQAEIWTENLLFWDEIGQFWLCNFHPFGR